MVPSLVSCVPFRISLIGFTKLFKSECAEGVRERGGEIRREREREERGEREGERERKELTNSHTHSRVQRTPASSE